MVLITFLALVAIVLSWGTLCALYFNLPQMKKELRDIHRRLNAVEIENVQLRIRAGEQELYPSTLELEMPEREQFSMQIGTKQVFGISKERPRRK